MSSIDWRPLALLRRRDPVFGVEVRALFEMRSHGISLAVIREGYGESTPFLVPLDLGAPPPPTRAQQEEMLHRDAEAWSRRELEALCATYPTEAGILRAVFAVWANEPERPWYQPAQA